jgi:2-dehydropantoate 2-reductase
MPVEKYKIGIVGGGAVGLTYAAMLAKTAEVLVKTRRIDHADKISASGISLFQDGVEEKFTGIEASANAAALLDCDAVIVTVKSYDTESVAKEISNFIKPNAEVLSLQNGLQGFDILQSVISNHSRVFTGVTYIGGTRIDDRSVILGNNRRVIVDSNAINLIKVLNSIKYKVESSTDIRQAVWDKMVLSTAQNALSAATNLSFGEMLESSYCLDVASHLLAEFEQVAKAEGIRFNYPLMDKLKNNWKAPEISDFHPSMWQDLKNGNRTEIDAINGAIGQLGEKHGIPTPYNSMTTSLIKILEKSHD